MPFVFHDDLLEGRLDREKLYTMPLHRRSLASEWSAHYDEGVNLTIELDREDDARRIAEAIELPGVMRYGQTRDEAISNTERLAIEVIADRIAHGEMAPSANAVSFSIPDEQSASH